jgi:hypothetical protein
MNMSTMSPIIGSRPFSIGIADPWTEEEKEERAQMLAEAATLSMQKDNPAAAGRRRDWRRGRRTRNGQIGHDFGAHFVDPHRRRFDRRVD